MNRVLSAAKTGSVVSDPENDGLAEIELTKLQRQYRIMESDRKAYSEESRLFITKQRSTVEILKRENESLMDSLTALQLRAEIKFKSSSGSATTLNLIEQEEKMQKRIKAMASEIQTLEKEISTVEKGIDQQRASNALALNAGPTGPSSSTSATSATTTMIDKHIRVLENRLDKSLTKYSTSLTNNKTLRGTIDHLRRERVMFDTLYRKLEKEMLDTKKKMADIIEASNAAYESRDEAQNKILALREKSEKEHQAYLQEMKDLERALEQDRKLKAFMAAKVSERLESAGGASPALSPRKVVRHVGNKEKEANQSSEMLAKSLATYEKAFDDIHKVTGLKDIKALVTRFRGVEEENFSLFNYVSQVNNDIEGLAEEIMGIQRKVDKIKVEAVGTLDQTNGELKKLETGLDSTQSKLQKFETLTKEASQTLSEICQRIEKSVIKMQETVSALPISASALPTVAGGVTEGNVLQAFGQLEHATNELLMLHYLSNMPKRAHLAATLLDENGEKVNTSGAGGLSGSGPGPAGSMVGVLGQGPAPILGQLSVVAPSTADEHESDDGEEGGDEEPLSREELKQKTLRGMNRREKGQSATQKSQVIKKKINGRIVKVKA